MNLDRVISYLTGAERLGAALQIARNIGDGSSTITTRPPGSPGTVSPGAAPVPAGAAEPDPVALAQALAQAGADADLYAQSAPPASRSLLGLRPPLADARTAANANARSGQPSAGSATTAARADATDATRADTAASAGSTVAGAGTADPVVGTSQADATDLPMSGQEGTGTTGESGTPLGAILSGKEDAAGPLADGTGTDLTGEAGADSSADAGPGAIFVGGAGSDAQAGDAPASNPASTDNASADNAAATTRGDATGTTGTGTTTGSAATASAARPDATVLADGTRLDILPRDPLAFAAATAAGAQPERAGIIASFVLNAAMIPGWPPPRAIEGGRLDAAIAVRQLQAGMDDAEAAGYLAKLGVPASLLARLAAWLEAFKRRARILFGVMVLIGSSLAVLNSLKEDEDEPDEDELMAPDGRARLFLR